MNKEISNIIKAGLFTACHIALMAQYRNQYLSERDSLSGKSNHLTDGARTLNEPKEKMYTQAFLSGFGVACLFAIGISGLIENRKNDYLTLD